MQQRITNIFFILKCFFRFLLFGRADKVIKPSKKVLVISTAKLGDMVCVTPVFRAIKKAYPAAEINVMGSEVNKNLLAYNPDIDHYIVYDGNSRNLISKLRVGNYDFACLTSPNFKALAIAYLAGIPAIAAPHVLGWKSPYETRSYKIIKKFVITVHYVIGRYMPREYLRLLEPIGIVSDDTKKHLGYSEQAKEKISGFIKRHIGDNRSFLIGIVPAAGNKIKLWPSDRFADVANFSSSIFGAKIILFGSAKEHEFAKKVGGEIKGAFFDTSSQLNIDELKAFIARLQLLIAVDTGPIYIAEAFGVATIDIVGPMDENEQPPIGEYHRIIVPPYRRMPQLHIMDTQSYDLNETKRQAESITSESVIEVLREFIPKLQNRR